MENKQYNIKYLETFITQFNSILYHLKYILKNDIATEEFYQEVIKSIEKRSENPMSFEVFKKQKKKE